MKKMLQDKNAVIAELRAKLAQYEQWQLLKLNFSTANFLHGETNSVLMPFIFPSLYGVLGFWGFGVLGFWVYESVD